MILFLPFVIDITKTSFQNIFILSLLVCEGSEPLQVVSLTNAVLLHVQISGAQFTIHDAVPGATAGRVVISGTPQQVKMGQSLMHAFIMWGRYIKDA